ncbi:hypothetical protein DQ04_01101020 [Trypanosoma grayi]|uniref:hypothetical protein n=1 Tax=Trypanosoma grayi TaxID=71804 RepID=UPI0004F4B17D|nr:hypothetical protein DQ04_01101020 [Trypanosoma grayi]KEG13281.1 hypothetical protein DQ04_01101020 [Trypanosoma grayi]
MEAATHEIRTERFEVDQYVRVLLSNGRSEIGVVVSIDEPNETAVIATRHGYDITVRLRSVRRAFLVVLDLNGVLVARGRGSFIDRPGVMEFVSFVMNNFVVAVWTSGLERTSNPIIEKVFDNYQDRLLFKLYRDACTMRPTPDKPYRTIKNLQRIFDAYPKSFHAVNTIIVDDSPDKCSHPDIALCPVPFVDPEKQIDDDGLAMATEVLKEVLRSESHAPLIRASEERLVALAAKEKRDRLEEQKQHEEAKKEVPLAATAASSSNNNSDSNDNNGTTVGGGAVTPDNEKDSSMKHEAAKISELPETFLWATRLCCDYISGSCTRKDCRFSHDADDGERPCSRKGFCRRGHARRWIDDLHSKSGTSTSAAPKGTNASTAFDVSNIVLLFSTNPDQQKRHQQRQHGGGRNDNAQYKQQQQQQRQQQQQHSRQPQSRQQQERGQKNTKGDGGGGGSSNNQREQKAVSPGKGSDHGSSRTLQLPWSQQGPLLSTPAPPSAAQGAAQMRFTGDSHDGGALLRHLQASLLGGMAAGGEENANSRSNKRKQRQY